MKKIQILFITFFIIFFIFYIHFFSNKTKEVSTFLKEDNCSDITISKFQIANPKFYDEAYKNQKKFKEEEEKVFGGIVNHHLLAPTFIAEVLETFKKNNPETIILISPNHFDHGQSGIQTSNLTFETPKGILKPDCKNLDKLLKENLLKIENKSFEVEHGILNILPFIARSIPKAKIIPIIIKENVSYEELNELSKYINKISHSVVLGSFDFSHELPGNIAEFKDKKSLDAIESFDMERVKNISIDSKKGIYLLQKIMEEKKAQKFVLFQNTNSGYLTNDINDATSYVTGVYKIGEPSPSKNITVLMFGDLMLDRYVAKRMFTNSNYAFQNIPNLFKGSDEIVANLEGVFSSNNSISEMDNDVLRFTFNPEFVSVLLKNNFTALSQANNHTLDFGREGMEESRKILQDNNLSVFGDFKNDDNLIVNKKIGEQEIALIGFNEFSYANYDKILALITKTKEENKKVIVMPHWGIEYETQSNPKQRELARKFIDAGADMIIGAHPHVVQEIEIYKGKLIAYSLGNFVFDQDFSKETREGMGLGLVFDSEKTEIFLISFNIISSELQLKSVGERKRFLEKLSQESQIELKEQILKGKIILNNE